MVLLPGCICCDKSPCVQCQEFCGYQITCGLDPTADDLDPSLGELSTVVGPTPCSVNVDGCVFYADGPNATVESLTKYIRVNSFHGVAGDDIGTSFLNSIGGEWSAYGLADGLAGLLMTDHWTSSRHYIQPLAGGNQIPLDRWEYVNARWRIGCRIITSVVDGVEVPRFAIVLDATLDHYVVTQAPVFNQSPVPFTFDGDYENEYPGFARRRLRSLTHVLSLSCREPDQTTALCLDAVQWSDGFVVDWRPAWLRVTIGESGVTIMTPGETTLYQWQTDDLPIDQAGWLEWPSTYKRPPDGETPYFDDPPPVDDVSWDATLITTSGSVSVAFDDFCGLSTPADEDTIEVPEGTPLPLGEEQGAYVNGYATDDTPDTNCPIYTYPSWSVYWKHKHLLITDLAVARCGDIPSVTTFKVWLYFDGLINDQLEGNEINGVPVGGFVMAVRSWDVTVILGQPPTITLDSSFSPCNADGEMPFCDGLVPEFLVTYGE